MSYPTYLVHFNKNHSSKDGKFTYGDGDGDGIIDDHRNQLSKNGKSLYQKLKKERNKVESVLSEKYKDSTEIKSIVDDKRVANAMTKLRSTVYDMPEYPDWHTDKETIDMAKKNWKRDFGYDYDPDNLDHDHKLFDYYLDSASEKSKTYQKKLQEYTDAFVKSNWEQAYDEYDEAVTEATKDFVGKYSNSTIDGIDYFYLVKGMVSRNLRED